MILNINYRSIPSSPLDGFDVQTMSRWAYDCLETAEAWWAMPTPVAGVPIGAGRFFVEMFLKSPVRGGIKLGKDAIDHPRIVAGILGAVVALTLLPAVCSDVVLYGSLAFSVSLGVYAIGSGLLAWHDRDPARLQEASAELGVALISLGMMKLFWKKAHSSGETNAAEFGAARLRAKAARAFAAISHASDEIAAGLSAMTGHSVMGGIGK